MQEAELKAVERGGREDGRQAGVKRERGRLERAGEGRGVRLERDELDRMEMRGGRTEAWS